MAKPKKIPRKKGAGRKPLPEHLKKRAEYIILRNEQWDEILKETTKEQLSESFWLWFKESQKYVEIKDIDCVNG